MEIIQHRVNRITELRDVDSRYGVEFDVRSRAGKLILAHEPHRDGDTLEDYLRALSASGRKGIAIFNPKEDGLENAIIAAAKAHRIERYFLLDLALPSLVRLSIKEKISEVAVRVSEYEPPGGTRRFRGKARWVWLDCFAGKPPEPALLRELKRDFKICLVSPELQGYSAESIRRFRDLTPLLDAVCTRHPDRWRA